MWNFERTRPLLLALVLLVLLVNAVRNRGSWITGDGTEYTLMSQGFLSHGTPDARLDDIARIHEAFAKHGRGAALPQEEHLARAIKDHAETSTGFFRSDNGRYYSYHFWLYPLINAPALFITHAAGLSPVMSFILTNSACMLAGIAVILYLGGLSPVKRIALLAFYVFGGTTYYLNWTHPEIFTFSCLLIGLLLFEQQRFLPAALLMAAAAQQNPPIGMLAACALTCCAYADIYRPWRAGMPVLKPVAGLVAITCLLMLSPLFYMARFHTPNLIKKIGAADESLISLDRLVSLYFDLDQGAIRGLPWVFLLLIVFLAIAAVRRHWLPRRSWLSVLLLLTASVLLALPALTTTNWNSGANVMMRYAYWIAVPVGLALANALAALPRRAAMAGVTILVLGQASVVIANRVYGYAEHNVAHSRAALALIAHFPDWYHPIPEIFAERAQGREIMDQDSAYLYVRHDRLRKVLVHMSGKRLYLATCGIELDPMSPGIRRIPAEGNWQYLDVDLPCHLADNFYVATEAFDPNSLNKAFQWNDPKGIDFSSAGNSGRYTVAGWSQPEIWGTWTDAAAATVQLRLPITTSDGFRIRIEGRGFVGDSLKQQVVTVKVNGQEAGRLVYTGGENSVREVFVPAAWVAQNAGRTTVQFLIDHPTSPAQLGMSADGRTLGLGLTRLTFSEVPEEGGHKTASLEAR